ncbi:putative sugar nucleotidyl transferase [Candidatus Palauibacter sp.]|uniref:putative sugar nucleotidyl transferase n=1 Tax=Candidatus Palauibacter sp. TaxID=3101350 RepID=UPI003AF2E35A
MTALFLFDDSQADGWAPFSLTRPCGELLHGRWTLRERLERLAGTRLAGHVTRPWLSRFVEAGAPPALDPGGLDGLPDACSYWSSRAVPALDAAWDPAPANLWVAGRLAGVNLAAGAPPPRPDWFAAPDPVPGLADRAVPGDWLHHPWDLVSAGPSRLAADLAATPATGVQELPGGCWQLGEAPIRFGEDVRVEPGVLFDTREGPIELGARVEIATGTRLAGPLYAGSHSRLLGGAISRFSGGPFSFVCGEVDSVTVLGYSNKPHDGFLGHAYLGRWVNLGAMTTNSDLKHTYGSIRVGPPDARTDTRLVKFGCLLGDHVKTGIGTRLDTGTIIGAGSSLFGADMPPKWVEPFSWGGGRTLERVRRADFIATAVRVAARRGIEADSRFRDWLGDIWNEAGGP